MGCDIHSFAEKKNKKKDTWEKAGNMLILHEEYLWEKVGDVFSLCEYDKKHYQKDFGDNPFDHRSYSVFAFLAGVRNYDCCEPLSEPKGIPNDVSDEIKTEYDSWSCDSHSTSYLTLRELLEFDYDKIFWNRRVTKQTSNNCWNGASLADEGEGAMISYRENLGEFFFTHLEELKSLGDIDDVRIVFWFDN